MLSSKEKFIRSILYQETKEVLNGVVFVNCRSKKDFLGFIRIVKEGNLNHPLLDNTLQLKRMGHVFLNVYLKNKLVAACQLDVAGDWAFLWRFAVRKKYRGRGIGSIILNKLVKVLKNNGCKVFQIYCPKNRENFYVPLGLKIITSGTHSLLEIIF